MSDASHSPSLAEKLAPRDLEWYSRVLARNYSYPDWWERSVCVAMNHIHPDGYLEEQDSNDDDCEGGIGWDLESEVNALLSAAGSFLPARELTHSVEPPDGTIVVEPSEIQRLNDLPVFEQRSAEWFQDRYSMISASVAWKAISSEAMRKSIVRDKTKVPTLEGGTAASSNPTSPLHWGHKYEPISTAMYSKWFKAEVAEYGSIHHPEYSFIGASPDGIVVSEGPMYGRMLEIKNVVNRELTGIPKRDYWIQMQIQMEVCNLPLCDFFECQFLEYSTWDEADADGCYDKTADGKPKGAFLMLFCPETNLNKYFYPPLSFTTKDEYIAWENETRKSNPNMEWVQRIWWRLENYSLVTVQRNKEWFASVLEQFKATWQEVLAAREVAASVKDIDTTGVSTEYDVPTNASKKAKWPTGTCLIRQDPEEDDGPC